jgi:hypothetical protein
LLPAPGARPGSVGALPATAAPLAGLGGGALPAAHAGPPAGAAAMQHHAHQLHAARRGQHDDPFPHQFEGSQLLVRTGMPSALSPAADAEGSIPIHGGMSAETEFETELFAGRFRVVFRVPEPLQAPEAAALLAGKKRQMWVMIQGRLKRPVLLEDLQYGGCAAAGCASGGHEAERRGSRGASV